MKRILLLILIVVACTSFAESTDMAVKVPLRYYRFSVPPDVESKETNTGYDSVVWNLPLANTALVLVDVWKDHFLLDTDARIDSIVERKIAPLVNICRNYGMKIIHAPGPNIAVKDPNWVKLVGINEIKPQKNSWPPDDFIDKNGIYKEFRRNFMAINPVYLLTGMTQSIHPKVLPVKGDAVVANGLELHRYCEQEKILFLIYAGFHPNGCFLTRDYGIIQMRFTYGYETMFLRDCTTAIETIETIHNLDMTNKSILILEMFMAYSLTSNDLISAFAEF